METRHLVFSGFKLGMLLQLGGIGPICVLLFQLPTFLSLPSVLLGVLGVTLADAIYISLAAFSITPFVKKIKKSNTTLKAISGIFLISIGLFFISTIWNEEQTIQLAKWLDKNIFLGLFLLTLMNPATIIVFTGIFTAELINRSLRPKDLFIFAIGVILTTPFFLGLVSIIGSISNNFLPVIAIKGLNVTVGLILIYWGLKYIFQKRKA